MNQGAWYQIRHRLQACLSRRTVPVLRRARALAAPRPLATCNTTSPNSSAGRAGAGRAERASAITPPIRITEDLPMTLEVKVPVLPESVADATLAAWHKKPGDAVRRDENLVDLETDKVVLEVPAPVDGVLKEIKQQTGATVTSRSVARDARGRRRRGGARRSGRGESSAGSARHPQHAAPSRRRGEVSRRPALRVADREQSSIRRRSRQRPRGRVTKEDLVELRRAVAPRCRRRAGCDGASPAVAPTPGDAPEERVPMTRMRATHRRAPGRRSPSPMLTTFNEVDLAGWSTLRKSSRKHSRRPTASSSASCASSSRPRRGLEALSRRQRLGRRQRHRVPRLLGHRRRRSPTGDW